MPRFSMEENQKLTQCVAVVAATVGILSLYLLSGFFLSSDLIILACCIYSIHAFVSKVGRFESFSCSETALICPATMLLEPSTRLMYVIIVVGGSLMFHLLISDVLACAWLMVFWFKTVSSYILHTYPSVEAFAEKHELVYQYLPISWIFSFRHQHTVVLRSRSPSTDKEL